MASAILSAKDIHNHLVPLALPRDTRAVVVHRPLLGRHFTKRGSSLPPYLRGEKEREKRRGRGVRKRASRRLRFLSSSLILFVSDSLDFLSLLSVFFDAIGNFRNFSRIHSTGARRSSSFILRGRDGVRNKGRRLRFLPYFAFLLFFRSTLCRSALLY